MILMLAAMAAAQMVPAKPVKPWNREEDYIQLVYSGQESASLIRVIVSPSGKPKSCMVAWSSGNARGDKLSCSLTMSRSEFAAARDDAGKPAWGEFQEVVNFYQSDGRESRFPMMMKPDLELIVQDLPEDATQAAVKIAMAIDHKGEVAACEGEAGEDEQLTTIACRQITTAWKATPALNAAGTAVPYVASRKVQFRTERRGQP